MATTTKKTDKLGLRYGIIAGVAMILYFFILKLLGLDHIEELRFVRYLFLGIAVIIAIATYKRSNNGHMPYLPGLGIGFVIGLVSCLLYGAFTFLYMNYVDQEFQNTLRTSDFFGAGLSPVMLFASNALFGIVGGAFTAYIFMMLYDRSGGNFQR